MKKIHATIILISVFASILPSCKSKTVAEKDEEIALDTTAVSDSSQQYRSIQGNLSFDQLETVPNSVLVTSDPENKLISVYQRKFEKQQQYAYNEYNDVGERNEHFLPGIDILYGYYLLNIAQYNAKTEKLRKLFDRPALIKTFYYPSPKADSINKIPITRNYYLVSVYDEDTNKDKFINRKDLRRFYHIDPLTLVKTLLIPGEYSVIRSEYDFQSDVLYVFAGFDTSKDGKLDKKEPIHIFGVDLKNPISAKRLYE